jgi:predicted aspartyl protease
MSAYTGSSGVKYVGEFKDSEFSGIGKLSMADGSVIQQGYWIANEYFGPTPPPGYRASNSGSRIVMVKSGGTYVVPVLINGALPLHFTVDSGAADVSIPSDVVSTLIRMGAIVDGDFTGSQKYELADGSIVNSRTFRIRSLKVGDRIVQNIRGSVAGPSGSLLLGQSFLEKFKSWSMDNTKHELVLE